MKKPVSRVKKAIYIISGVLIILLLAAGTYVLAFYSEVKEAERVLLDDFAVEEQDDVAVDSVFSERIVNIALLGFDRGWNREAYGEDLFRPDMIAVFSIDFEADKISVVRIPRDSYVPIYGTGGFYDKINHSFYYGYQSGGGEDREAEGIRYTLETVRNVLGDIPIHYYVSVDMYSVIELVDALGGIYYESEKEIIDKHWEIGRVLVPEGPQLMDGKTFLRYLQYREDETGQDFGRIDRQMNLLKESFLYLREKGRITDIPTTFRIYKDYVDTDLTYTQIAALAYYGRDIDVEDETLNFYTLQGDGQMKDGIWYLVLRDGERRQVIKEVFGVEAAPWPEIVLEDSPEYLEEQKRKEEEELEEKELEEEELQEEAEQEEKSQDEDRDLNGDHDESLNEEEVFTERMQVPEVRGISLREAKSILRDKGFTVGRVTGRSSFIIEEGLVIRSQPVSGSRVTAGTEIELFVSEGPDWNNADDGNEEDETGSDEN